MCTTPCSAWPCSLPWTASATWAAWATRSATRGRCSTAERSTDWAPTRVVRSATSAASAAATAVASAAATAVAVAVANEPLLNAFVIPANAGISFAMGTQRTLGERTMRDHVRFTGSDASAGVIAPQIGRSRAANRRDPGVRRDDGGCGPSDSTSGG
ncbi:exported protein of unknown function [Micropruina glycogenica]|uniref:Uncharacterized protein n=1 Tax=Micropruina glycogenica TaxID=75385 RepID=A0A2N9JE38_9ACTN|nr:exported protein of unknown function [Micropruina glycogenica]